MQAKDFTAYAIRAVLSGRGDKVVDLSETTLLGRLFSAATPDDKPGAGDTCPAVSVRDLRQARVQQYEVVVTPGVGEVRVSGVPPMPQGPAFAALARARMPPPTSVLSTRRSRPSLLAHVEQVDCS
ncbi:hypothetical protein EF294_17385 [Gordonia oryzae]|uniref:Uncharacterized protein n=1 Tax=Gordonia oryzae TaxID=2487349 RepID=A0A3N4G700_9ACTN|nr:hypothetical protein [Gordonia oryzae]RPA57848.1 hypothetical protein EF294_17385 [Gordonia oryzae]